MALFHLEITAPDGNLYEGDAYMLSVRGMEGELSVLAGHIPFVTALSPGKCRVYTQKDQPPRQGHAGGGVLSVTPDGVRLLAADFTWEDA